MEAIPTPGHSDDGVAFVVNGEICFSGDTLFRDAVGGGPAEIVRASVMERLMTLDHGLRVLPGHTVETTIGREWERNPFVRYWRGLEREVELPVASAAWRAPCSWSHPTTTGRASCSSASTAGRSGSSARPGSSSGTDPGEPGPTCLMCRPQLCGSVSAAAAGLRSVGAERARHVATSAPDTTREARRTQCATSDQDRFRRPLGTRVGAARAEPRARHVDTSAPANVRAGR